MSEGDLRPVARAALAGHGLPPHAELTLLNVSENHTFAVRDPRDGSRSVLRLHRPGYHSRAAIDSELTWLAALAPDLTAAGVGVVRPLPAPGGQCVVEAVDAAGTHRRTVRFAWIEGDEPPPGGRAADFARLGAVAARLHRQARRWRPPAGFTRLRWDVDTAVGRHGHWGDWRVGPGVDAAERALLEAAVVRITADLAGYGTGPDRFGLVHADMRLANLLLDADGGLHVIDFDDCGFSWFMYDLAAALSFFEHEPQVPALVAAWVEGYRGAGEIDADDLAVLPALVMLRRLLLLAWLGTHAETDTARELAPRFAAGSCDLAQRYLDGTLAAAFPPP